VHPEDYPTGYKETGPSGSSRHRPVYIDSDSEAESEVEDNIADDPDYDLVWDNNTDDSDNDLVWHD
jgi:hypothetical protein